MKPTLNNTVKDVIGYLRAAYIVILIWNCVPLEFPLDTKMRLAFAKFSGHFERALLVACRICRINEDWLRLEMRSAIDDIVSPDTAEGYYSEDTLDLLFSLYAANPASIKVAGLQEKYFYKETSLIFDRLVLQLISSMLWSRVLFYDEPMDAVDTSLKEQLREFFQIICEITHPNVIMIDREMLLKVSIDKWLKPSVAQGELLRNQALQENLAKVARELE